MMNDAQRIVDEAISDVAPEIDLTELRPDDQLRSSARLDSLDFLHVLAAIHQRCGVEVPEHDYAAVATYGELIDYVRQAVTSRG